MFFQIAAANKRKTVLLVLIMGVVLALLGFFVGELVDMWVGFTSAPQQAGHAFKAGYIGLCVALVIWLGLLLTGLFGSDQLFLSLSGAKEVTHELYPQLYNIIEEMKIASSLPKMPDIYIIDDPAPNAFAVGKSPEDSSICVTAGLLAICGRDELQGVVAHEMGHILNRDVLFMTVAATMLGAVTLIADSFLHSLRYAPIARYRSSSSRTGKGLINVWLIMVGFSFVIFSPILSRILYFAISRSREYLADATSARLTRYPEGLASALEKIMLSPEKLTTAPKATAPFYITNPYKQDLDDSMFATHPPLGQRIKILRLMSAGAAFKDYVKAYWAVTHTHKELIAASDMDLGVGVTIREPSPPTDQSEQGPQGAAGKAGDIIRAMNRFVFINCACGMKMKIPPEFARGDIRCPRCNRPHTVKEADQLAMSAILANTDAFSKPGQPQDPQKAKTDALIKGYQEETRVPGTWQSFTCNSCGRIVQVSPAFKLPQLNCTHCGHLINFH
jgi:heat shock protein HtpX